MPITICQACGTAFRGEGGTCVGCGEPIPSSGEIRRLPHEVVLSFLEHAEEFLVSSPPRQLVLALAAGSFITFGAVLSVALTTGVEPTGLSRLLLGLGFSAGFVMVILSGSALFTEINVLLPEMFLSRPRDLCRRCWRFWLIVYVGNAGGALIVGLMIASAELLGEPQHERLFELLEEKMALRELGTRGWFAVLLSGILGSWLVGMAAFLATAARTVSGKIIGILFPIVTFVAIGVQHSPANMGYFSVGLIEGGSGIGWGEAIWWNIVPASIGNIIGGSVLVALLFWYTYGKHPQGRQSLRSAGELARRQAGKAESP